MIKMPRKWTGGVMFNWAITFLIIAIIAGVLGFGGIVGISIEMAKIAFFCRVDFSCCVFAVG
jgi:uncharacterized membrane protein YtjA (UPF0391 family)